MRRIASLAVAIAALSFGATQQGTAADLPVKAIPMAPVAVVYNWTGFYIGVQGGYAWGHARWDYVPPAAVNQNHDTSGWLIGGTIGYNRHLAPQWVIGIEADLAGADIDGGTFCPNPVFRCQTKVSAIGTLRGRIGYAFNKALLYATAGGAAGRLRAETVQLAGVGVPPTGTPTNGTTSWHTGWTAGAGLEWGFAHNWSAKFEYLYVNLGRKTHTVDFGLVVNTGENISIARVGINYRFAAAQP